MQVATVLFCVLIGFAASRSIPNVEDPEWSVYKIMFGKEYEDAFEEVKSYETFCDQREKFAEHNKRHEASGEWIAVYPDPIEITPVTYIPPNVWVTGRPPVEYW